jgi:hypothetical protein
MLYGYYLSLQTTSPAAGAMVRGTGLEQEAERPVIGVKDQASSLEKTSESSFNFLVEFEQLNNIIQFTPNNRLWLYHLFILSTLSLIA